MSNSSSDSNEETENPQESVCSVFNTALNSMYGALDECIDDLELQLKSRKMVMGFSRHMHALKLETRLDERNSMCAKVSYTNVLYAEILGDALDGLDWSKYPTLFCILEPWLDVKRDYFPHPDDLMYYCGDVHLSEIFAMLCRFVERTEETLKLWTAVANAFFQPGSASVRRIKKARADTRLQKSIAAIDSFVAAMVESPQFSRKRYLYNGLRRGDEWNY